MCASRRAASPSAPAVATSRLSGENATAELPSRGPRPSRRTILRVWMFQMTVVRRVARLREQAPVVADHERLGGRLPTAQLGHDGAGRARATAVTRAGPGDVTKCEPSGLTATAFAASSTGAFAPRPRRDRREPERPPEPALAAHVPDDRRSRRSTPSRALRRPARRRTARPPPRARRSARAASATRRPRSATLPSSDAVASDRPSALKASRRTLPSHVVAPAARPVAEVDEHDAAVVPSERGRVVLAGESASGARTAEGADAAERVRVEQDTTPLAARDEQVPAVGVKPIRRPPAIGRRRAQRGAVGRAPPHETSGGGESLPVTTSPVATSVRPRGENATSAVTPVPSSRRASGASCGCARRGATAAGGIPSLSPTASVRPSRLNASARVRADDGAEVADLARRTVEDGRQPPQRPRVESATLPSSPRSASVRPSRLERVVEDRGAARASTASAAGLRRSAASRLLRVAGESSSATPARASRSDRSSAGSASACAPSRCAIAAVARARAVARACSATPPATSAAARSATASASSARSRRFVRRCRSVSAANAVRLSSRNSRSSRLSAVVAARLRPVERRGEPRAAVQLGRVAPRRVPVRRRLREVPCSCRPAPVLVEPRREPRPLLDQRLVHELDVSRRRRRCSRRSTRTESTCATRSSSSASSSARVARRFVTRLAVPARDQAEQDPAGDRRSPASSDRNAASA